MKLKPLQQFICDECQGVIEKVDDGWLEWFDDYKILSMVLELYML